MNSTRPAVWMPGLPRLILDDRRRVRDGDGSSSGSCCPRSGSWRARARAAACTARGTGPPARRRPTRCSPRCRRPRSGPARPPAPAAARIAPAAARIAPEGPQRAAGSRRGLRLLVGRRLGSRLLRGSHPAEQRGDEQRADGRELLRWLDQRQSHDLFLLARRREQIVCAGQLEALLGPGDLESLQPRQQRPPRDPELLRGGETHICRPRRAAPRWIFARSAFSLAFQRSSTCACPCVPARSAAPSSTVTVPSSTGSLSVVERQVLGLDLAAVAQQQRALDHVAQLADVARPGVGLEQRRAPSARRPRARGCPSCRRQLRQEARGPAAAISVGRSRSGGIVQRRSR